MCMFKWGWSIFSLPWFWSQGIHLAACSTVHWCNLLVSSFGIDPSGWPCLYLEAVPQILKIMRYVRITQVSLWCSDVGCFFVSAVLQNNAVHLLLVWCYWCYCCTPCLGETLFSCFRSLGTVSLAFAAVLWVCPHCCPYSCHTFLLAPADVCYSLRNPTRVQVSWFCCLCILLSLYVDLFIACSIMFVDASCSESEARFDPPAGVLQYGLCSRIDLWYDFTQSACKLLCNM